MVNPGESRVRSGEGVSSKGWGREKPTGPRRWSHSCWDRNQKVWGQATAGPSWELLQMLKAGDGVRRAEKGEAAAQHSQV